MDELDMSVSRSWTKMVIASRYSSPVIVMLPSVALPTLVLSIVSIVVMTEVAAAELTVAVFIWLRRNADTVSVVAAQLPPGMCLVFWDVFGKYSSILPRIWVSVALSPFVANRMKSRELIFSSMRVMLVSRLETRLVSSVLVAVLMLVEERLIEVIETTIDSIELDVVDSSTASVNI